MRTQDLIALLGVLAAGSYVISALARAAVLWRTRTAAARDTGAFEERLARLERAVEGLAVDTQRVTDGQRFLTQLLADRASASAPASGVPARVVRE